MSDKPNPKHTMMGWQPPSSSIPNPQSHGPAQQNPYGPQSYGAPLQPEAPVLSQPDAPRQYGQPDPYAQPSQQQHGQPLQQQHYPEQQYGQPPPQQQHGQFAPVQPGYGQPAHGPNGYGAPGYGEQSQQQYGQQQYPPKDQPQPQRGHLGGMMGRMPGMGQLSGQLGAFGSLTDPVRIQFIKKTYLHLTGAILLFAGLLWILTTNGAAIEYISEPIINFALFGGRWNWLAFMGLFVAAGYLAERWAENDTSRGMQYAGLGLYVVAEALIFIPLLAVADWKVRQIMATGGEDPHFIRNAAFITLGIFGALTASVLISKKDFSFIRSGLSMVAGSACVLIVLSILGGFHLGLLFSFLMVALAGGYILYYTSQILAKYHPDAYVAAALGLFSAIALMFWYVIRLLMRR